MGEIYLDDKQQDKAKAISTVFQQIVNAGSLQGNFGEFASPESPFVSLSNIDNEGEEIEKEELIKMMDKHVVEFTKCYEELTMTQDIDEDKARELLNDIGRACLTLEKIPEGTLTGEEKKEYLDKAKTVQNGLRVMLDEHERKMIENISRQKKLLFDNVEAQKTTAVPSSTQTVIDRRAILDQCQLDKENNDKSINAAVFNFENRFMSLAGMNGVWKTESPEQQPFTLDDIEQLKQCIEKLEQYEPSEEEKPVIDAYLGNLKTGLKQVEEALENCRNKLSNLTPEELALVSDELLQNKNSPDYASKFNGIADIYWTCYPPFGIKISFSSLFPNNESARRCDANFKEIFTLKTFKDISAQSLKEIHEHNINRLKQLRGQNQEKWKGNAPNITVIGGGPGGLTRGIVAGVLGTNWQVVEKRDRTKEGWSAKARKNVVKISGDESIQLLMFTGAVDSMIINQKAHLESRFIGMTIGSLEEALDESIKAVSDNHGKFVNAKATGIVTGYVEDETHKKTIVTTVNVEGREQLPTRTADIIAIAAGGIGEKSAGGIGIGEKVFGDKREDFSTETMMFAVNLSNCEELENENKYSNDYKPENPDDIEFTHRLYGGTIGTTGYATIAVSGDLTLPPKTGPL